MSILSDEGFMRLAGLLFFGLVVGSRGSAIGAQTGQFTLGMLEKIPESVEAKDFSMSYYHSSCFGGCPDFVVTLSGDGTLKYRGNKNVLITGDHGTRVAPSLARELLDKFRKADFVTAKADYGTNQDASYRVLTLSVEGKEKSVQGDGVPDVIGNIMVDLDRLAARWTMGTHETPSALIEEKWDFGAATPENLHVYSKMILDHETLDVEKFLIAGAPIISSDGTVLSPVCVAGEMGDVKLVRRMIASTRNASTRTSALDSMSASAKYECLSASAASGSVPLFDFWLKQGASLQEPSAEMHRAFPTQFESGAMQKRPGAPKWYPGSSLLSNGLTSDSLPMVRKMLLLPKPSPKDIQNGLMIALESMDPTSHDGHEIKIVRLLLTAGAVVTANDVADAAGYKGSERVALVRLLLRQAGQTPISRERPCAALAEAVRSGGHDAAKTVRLLVRAGADVTKPTYVEGPSVLSGASCHPEPIQKQWFNNDSNPGVCSPEVVKPLLEGGLQLNAVDSNGWTPLMNFASREEMVRELLADGADPTIVGKDGMTASLIAEKYGCSACVILIDRATEKWVAGVR